MIPRQWEAAPRSRFDLDTGFLLAGRCGGYSLEDIDTVFCTHLHIDHVGWNMQLQDGEWVPTFPNATYVSRPSTTAPEPRWGPVPTVSGPK